MYKLTLRVPTLGSDKCFKRPHALVESLVTMNLF